MKPLKLLCLLTALLSFVLPVSAQEDEHLYVVATTTQLGDLARIIGGDQIEVTQLMGGGTEPHLYRFTEADIQAIGEADVLIYSGLHLEGRIDEVFEANQSQTTAYPIAEPVEQQGLLLPSAADLSLPDPHFWFDPRNWQLATPEMVEILSEHDPDNAEFFADNGNLMIEQL